MLGFVDDSTREWLYQNALAFVYPSRYEGFGLPVLEALRYGTPVITSYNSSLKEITNDVVVYTDTGDDIRQKVIELLYDKKYKVTSEQRQKQAELFSWMQTANTVMSELDKFTG